jgi:hypothetical protein
MDEDTIPLLAEPGWWSGPNKPQKIPQNGATGVPLIYLQDRWRTGCRLDQAGGKVSHPGRAAVLPNVPRASECS